MINMINNVFEFINNSKLLSIILTTIIIILGINLIIYIINFLKDVRKFIQNKSMSYYLTNQKNKNIDNVALSMPERIELTNSILDLITFMINNEIVSLFKSYIALNNPYDMSRMDEDVESISKLVFTGISEQLFINPNLVLTKEYLIKFITKKTISIMIEVSQHHNASLRQHNQSVGD